MALVKGMGVAEPDGDSEGGCLLLLVGGSLLRGALGEAGEDGSEGGRTGELSYRLAELSRVQAVFEGVDVAPWRTSAGSRATA